MPAITSSVIINLIGGLQLFDIIKALTPVAPTGAQSMSTYLTYVYFNKESAGFANVMGIFMFLFILIVNTLATKFFDKREEQML